MFFCKKYSVCEKCQAASVGGATETKCRVYERYAAEPWGTRQIASGCCSSAIRRIDGRSRKPVLAMAATLKGTEVIEMAREPLSRSSRGRRMSLTNTMKYHAIFNDQGTNAFCGCFKPWRVGSVVKYPSVWVGRHRDRRWAGR